MGYTKIEKERIVAGLCRECGSPATPNMKTCEPCRAKLREKNNAYYHRAKERILEMDKARRDRDKKRVIEYYGGCCACCGETELQFLSVDHINNDGAEHRQNMRGKSGTGARTRQMMAWIIRNNFPDTFQILCFNCNWSKHLNGGVCVHKTRVDKLLRTV